MKKTIRIISAIIAILFSLLTIVEGSKVLLGITNQDYTVFTPLLIYNVIMGIVGLSVGGAIWFNHKKVFTSTKIVLIMHSIVLVIVITLYLLSNVVAMHSVQAMIIRVIVWVVISILVWKSNQSKINNKNNVEQLDKGYSNEK
ncbi:MAG: hypothetical protein IPJ03_08795 [Ignavibacteriales bacterium]|nr:hypothetical protein [Ignavibacteriales bacterium]